MSVRETVVCMECGMREGLRWDLPTNRRLKEHRRCFTCDHFLSLLEGFPKDSLRIDGGHYMAGPEDKSPSVFRGFGGWCFVIERFTGERITTTNLWHQGTIPEHLRERMPDNARFQHRFTLTPNEITAGSIKKLEDRMRITKADEQPAHEAERASYTLDPVKEQ